MSVDLHKFGYTAKGASVIVHRTQALRRYQVFVTERWLGGIYGSSGVLGTKSGGAIAAAWAVLHHLGDDGYLRLARIARAATEALADGHRGPAGAGAASADRRPCCWPSARPTPSALDVFAVADALWRRGWYVDRQGPPPSLHCTVNAVHEHRIPDAAASTCAPRSTRCSPPALAVTAAPTGPSNEPLRPRCVSVAEAGYR